MQNTQTISVCESTDHQPEITLSGAWLNNCRFSINDTVTVTCTEPGILVVQLNLSAPEMEQIRETRKHELEILTPTSGPQYEANIKVVKAHQEEMQKPPVHQPHQAEQQPVINQLPMEIRHKPIKFLQKNDRLQNQLWLKGSDSFSDAELLAIILQSGSEQHSAVDLARQILACAKNNLVDLGRCTIPNLMKIKGIGIAKAAAVMAALEIGRRRQSQLINTKTRFRDSRSVAGFIRPLISDYVCEVFGVLYLDQSGGLIKWELVSRGGITGTVVDPRIVFKNALENCAPSIIVFHNHPSGNTKPSKADEILTKKLGDGAALLDIKLLDHIIIADGYFSFADEGLLNSRYRRNIAA